MKKLLMILCTTCLMLNVATASIFAEKNTLSYSTNKLSADVNVKRIRGFVKMQIRGGMATPDPPVGPYLRNLGLSEEEIKGFCDDFNSKTQKKYGISFPVIVKVFTDNTYVLDIKDPPASTIFVKGDKIKSKIAIITRELTQVVNGQANVLNNLNKKSNILVKATVVTTSKVIENVIRKSSCLLKTIFR